MKKMIYLCVSGLSAFSLSAQKINEISWDRFSFDLKYQMNLTSGEVKKEIGNIHGMALNFHYRPFKKFAWYIGFDGSLNFFKSYTRTIEYVSDAGAVNADLNFFSQMYTYSLYSRYNLNKINKRLVYYVDAKFGKANLNSGMTVTTIEGTTTVTTTTTYDNCQVDGETYTVESTQEVPNVVVHERETVLKSSSTFGYFGAGIKLRLADYNPNKPAGIYFDFSAGYYFGTNLEYAVGYKDEESINHCNNNKNHQVITAPFINPKTSDRHDHAIGYRFSAPFTMFQLKTGISFTF